MSISVRNALFAGVDRTPFTQAVFLGAGTNRQVRSALDGSMPDQALDRLLQRGGFSGSEIERREAIIARDSERRWLADFKNHVGQYRIGNTDIKSNFLRAKPHYGNYIPSLEGKRAIKSIARYVEDLDHIAECDTIRKLDTAVPRYLESSKAACISPDEEGVLRTYKEVYRNELHTLLHEVRRNSEATLEASLRNTLSSIAYLVNRARKDRIPLSYLFNDNTLRTQKFIEEMCRGRLPLEETARLLSKIFPA